VTTAIGVLMAAGAAAVLRSLVGRHLNRPGRLPVGTLAVNVAGALALGMLAGADAPTATVVGVGGLGGLTTFSTLAVEVDALVADDRFGTAVAYVAVTVVLGVGAAGAGLALVA
jgi:CrcB protein